MAYNHAKAEIEFLAMWEKKSAEYREAGMDEDSIHEMYKLERKIFCPNDVKKNIEQSFPTSPSMIPFRKKIFREDMRG